MTSKTNFIVNNGEKVVHDDVPEKKKSKITILSEIRILPKTDKNKKAQTTRKEEGKAGPSGITIKRELQNAGPSVLNTHLKKDVKRKSIRTKNLQDNSSDSNSDCCVQYVDSSDYDSIEDMQDYLLRQLIEDQKMDEKEQVEQMTYLETKGHETESLRTESDVWIKNEMLNDKEKEKCGKQEIEEQMKELETKGHEKENLRIESDERNGQNVEKQMVNEYKIENDGKKRTEDKTT
ncbi:unnamed protein product [Parnassius apollo]|uniref:(apollo) hypothetical protein n=1 Tax=Parnassius apollo TaxID=110799 RepID=A0A8S3YBC4_PARAO|nr:unnamed protein product [Parnassius apollo]